MRIVVSLCFEDKVGICSKCSGVRGEMRGSLRRGELDDVAPAFITLRST